MDGQISDRFLPANAVKTFSKSRTTETPASSKKDPFCRSNGEKTRTNTKPGGAILKDEKVIKPLKFKNANLGPANKVIKPKSNVITSTPIKQVPMTPYPERSLSDPDWHEDQMSLVSDISSIINDGLISLSESDESLLAEWKKTPAIAIVRAKSPILPSKKIISSVKESQYLYGTFPKHLLDKKDDNTSDHDVVGRSNRIRKSSSTHSSRGLQKSASSHSTFTPPTGKPDLSPHLKYGIFGRRAGIKKSRSSSGVSQNVSNDFFEVLVYVQNSIPKYFSYHYIFQLSASCQKLQRQNEKLQVG